MNRGSYPRRYDLDALRATAMLLGIVLHAGLSFTPFPWAVQDERQSGFFWFLFASIHGFRMPVFFVLSGFFTAMLWRRRGLKSLLSHRFRRVLLPFLLGLVTIVPAVNWISGGSIASGLEVNAVKAEEDNIWSAAKTGDLAAIERHLQGGADINGIDPVFGQTPLVWAALVGQLEVVDWLLQNGARGQWPHQGWRDPLARGRFPGTSGSRQAAPSARSRSRGKKQQRRYASDGSGGGVGTDSVFGGPVADRTRCATS